MKVLMVGCGAVGQTLGLYLQKAGVELCFYARPETAPRFKQALEQGGLPLFQIGFFQKQDPIKHLLKGYQVVTDLEESRRFQPDQIWFTTPSTVFYSPWFQSFLQEVPSKRVVCFAPEGSRDEFIPPDVTPDRLVFGGITFISWQGNLDRGGKKEEAVNYWLSPLSQIPLVGEKQACQEVADLLKKSGIKAAARKSAFLEMQAGVTGVMSAFVVGYELAGWSLGAYRRSPWLKIAARAAQEAALSQLWKRGILVKSLFRIISTPAVFYVVTLLLPVLTPFDLEKYLKFHYHKTRDQTINLLEIFARDGQEQELPVGNIKLILQGLVDSRGT